MRNQYDIDGSIGKTYAIEFDGRSILQAYGKYNSTIPEEDYKVILKWVQLAKVIITADKQTLEFLT